MLIKVPTVRTTCTDAELCEALILAWQSIYNVLPQKKSIAVIISQHNVETGSGISCWNWNLGNEKAADVAGQNVEYCALTGVWEIINGKKVILPPENPGSWFRSFKTLKEGVAFHIDFLKNHRYKNAWTAIEQGDPAGFAHLLKMAKYYTAPEADYVKLMLVFFNKFMKDQTFESVIAKLNTQIVEQPIMTTNQPVVDNGQVVPPSKIGGILNGFFNLFKSNS